MCNGDTYVTFDADYQKIRASYILDTTFLAAVEKKRWSNQTRWGYHIVALESDRDIVHRAQQAQTRSSDTIDLSGPSSSGATTPHTNVSSPGSSGLSIKLPRPLPAGDDNTSDDTSTDGADNDDALVSSDYADDSNDSDDSDDNGDSDDN